MNDDFDMELGTEIEEDNIENQFENTVMDDDDFNNMDDSCDDNSVGIKKGLIIAIAISLVLVISAIMIWKTAKYKNKSNDNINTDYSKETIEQVEDDLTTDVDKVDNNNVVVSKSDNEWTDIGNKENVQYNDNNVEALFTVTNINHKARMNGNEIEILSEISGSISGFTGTYSIQIDYNKGTKLNVGDVFSVSVVTGVYEGKTVVGTIYVE